MALPLLLVYLALSYKPGDNLLPNLILGALLSLGVSLLLPRRNRPFNWAGVLPFLIGILQYAALIFVDMLKSAYLVAKILLDPALPIRPGIIAIDAGCQSELATALSAHAITLTPGEMVVAMDERGILYTHTLNVERSAQDAEEAQTLRRKLLSKIVA
ncbi:MAG: Na+/H+ antiporter subunit E [Anaerolineales bacterium]|jgi:multicomponent Na+:H+ antiporter subunit E|nr:Na+/H+ antiporter subunit E [Anaerolineales bacterium]